MIRTLYLSPDLEMTHGGPELADRWQREQEGFLWLDIEGKLTEKDILLLQSMGCHELAIRDCQRLRHPPKIEKFADNSFVLFRGITKIEEDLSLIPQQIGFFIGEKTLVTVHPGQSLSINHYWTNDESAKLLVEPLLLASRIMHYSAGLYLEVVLDFENVINDMEDRLLGSDPDIAMRELTVYRANLLKLRRVFNYHEKLSNIMRNENSESRDTGLSPDIGHSVRDFYDRCERLHSLTTMYYEICSNLIESHISLCSHQLNVTMRILTVITAIFVPLGFMAGVYGMNFDNMPELHGKYSYYILLAVMASTAIGLATFFKLKKWL
jgi:magnesium transporter